MDRAELIKMANDAGGSEFRTESGNDHTRINHFFEMTIDELELFASMVRKQMCEEACKRLFRVSEGHVREELHSIANGY
jgi:hypothetical protein